MPANPCIGVMIGDPAGIGPEVCVRALASGRPQARGRIVLIGSAEVLRRAAGLTGVDLPVTTVSSPEEAALIQGIAVIDPGAEVGAAFEIGRSSAESGRAAKAWIDRAEQLSKDERLDGWIMAPVDTGSMRMAGVLQELDDLQPQGTFMFRMSGPLRVVPIAEHLPMRAVAASVTAERISHVARMTRDHLIRWGMASPRLSVAALNPHGMFEEDRDIIAPAVAALRAEGLDIAGPVSPDAVFRQCIEGRYDAVISMYHDQGQIALKTAAFAGACTVYLGLPYVQLSVPHGTAFDIAGKGVAQPDSMIAAMTTALSLAGGVAFLDEATE
ncbi:4-hydroxythreonine-4-phosphate dehydrogenase [Paracoccus subflavus]|uniref:4-hydroxythreonine-4-phosphate dehydrogenase n=1 Tax=Paracoccus subflavus TaxID=2528244 RepID=A0A4Q9FV97_9RHOB|nr:4-hydroxythreonine-4-phosphate dehydrogenase PdxA [Paracoccus subflavus]TBN36375.1 4-hydroxythreonine-4-phosphate dehydrogenase [Paracoccus subflavus]